MLQPSASVRVVIVHPEHNSSRTLFSISSAHPSPVLGALNTLLSSLQSKSSLDGLDDKETQPPLPPKADRYNQLTHHQPTNTLHDHKEELYK